MERLNIVANQAARRKAAAPQAERLSSWSTLSVPDSAWCSTDFMLGAGMVIIQPSTSKIVLVFDTNTERWFLPKGRKDLGESLEQTALREAYEESGYRVEFLPLWIPSNAPPSSNDPDAPYLRNTEPIFVTTLHWKTQRKRQPQGILGGEYLTSWYVGQIPADAVPEKGTGMPDEQTYVSHLMTYDEAISKIRFGVENRVLQYAWALWQDTLEIEAEHSKARQAAEPSATSAAERKS